MCRRLRNNLTIEGVGIEELELQSGMRKKKMSIVHTMFCRLAVSDVILYLKKYLIMLQKLRRATSYLNNLSTSPKSFYPCSEERGFAGCGVNRLAVSDKIPHLKKYLKMFQNQRPVYHLILNHKPYLFSFSIFHEKPIPVEVVFNRELSGYIQRRSSKQ